MNIIIELFIKTLAVMVTAYILPGVTISGFWVALVLAIILGAINLYIKPIIILLTLPINILTLGLFTFVINAFLIKFAAYITPGFSVEGFWWALSFSIVLTLINIFLHLFV